LPPDSGRFLFEWQETVGRKTRKGRRRTAHQAFVQWGHVSRPKGATSHDGFYTPQPDPERTWKDIFPTHVWIYLWGHDPAHKRNRYLPGRQPHIIIADLDELARFREDLKQWVLARGGFFAKRQEYHHDHTHNGTRRRPR
jgi:hypothetical protein